MLENTRHPRRTAEQWQTIVDQQIESGLSGAAFCKTEGIKYQSFMNWRMKLSASPDVLSNESTFIELTAPENTADHGTSSWLIELDLAPGVQLRIAR